MLIVLHNIYLRYFHVKSNDKILDFYNYREY